MTTPLDDELLPELAAAMDEYGIDVVFQSVTLTYTHTTSTTTESDPSNHTWKILPPAPIKERYRERVTSRKATLETYTLAEDGDGTEIPFTPALRLRLTEGSNLWRIVELDEFRSGTIIVAWRLGLAK